MKRLFAVAVLAVAFSASLPAQGTDETAASFHDEPKAELAVELIKKYEGLHDRSDYPYYGYGHCKLPGEELSYDMTEAEAEAEELLRKDLAERYKLFRKYKKDALLLTVLSYNVGHGTLLGYGKRPKSRLLKKLETGDRNIYMEYISYCHYKGRKIRSIERRRKMEFLLLYEK